MDDIRLYTLDEVAELFHVSRKTMYRKIHDKSIKAFKIGNEWRIPSESVRSYLDAELARAENAPTQD